MSIFWRHKNKDYKSTRPNIIYPAPLHIVSAVCGFVSPDAIYMDCVADLSLKLVFTAKLSSEVGTVFIIVPSLNKRISVDARDFFYGDITNFIITRLNTAITATDNSYPPSDYALRESVKEVVKLILPDITCCQIDYNCVVRRIEKDTIEELGGEEKMLRDTVTGIQIEVKERGRNKSVVVSSPVIWR